MKNADFNLTPQDAYVLAVPDGPVESGGAPHSTEEAVAMEPPSWAWQFAARKVVEMAEETLSSSEGEPALTYLLDRGLNTRTSRASRLGYVPGDSRQWRKIEELEVPCCGIAIPWFASGALWAVKVRRAYGTPKYQQVRGGNTSGLYRADHLAEHEAALFCEGEFDALLANQEASDLAAAVTLSSATATLNAHWYAELTQCHTLLVAYDQDAAGEKGANRLLAISPRFHVITVPQGKDIGEFYLQGGDVYAWIEKELGKHLPVLERLPHAP